MARLGPYEVHPFADVFPLLEGEEFEELTWDIKRNGLREPILLTHDKTMLIDGRNRYRACAAAGVEPACQALPADYTETTILDLIVSKNMTRRQLNPGQKALMALEYEKHYAAAATIGYPKGKDRTRSDVETPADLPEFRRQRESREKAAKAVGASGRATQQAKALQRDTPDLAQQVRAGGLSLDAADKQRRQRVRNQPKPVPTRPARAMLTLYTHEDKPVEYPEPSGRPVFNETRGDGISWAAWSWNPVTGCLHGCDYCYAREIATSERFRAAYPAGFTPLFHEERLDAPSNTVIPATHRDEETPCHPYGCPYHRVFVCSMADLYGRWVPDEWIKYVHESMLAAPQWEYLLLTKFPDRYVGLDLPPNAWVGTTVDEQKRVRIAERAFRQIDGVKVKWLSLEPLLEPLEFTDLSMFDWVVIGAQTQTNQPDGPVPAFEPPAEWVVRITAQALDAGCRVHWKPNLRTGPGMQWLDQYPDGAA